MDEWNETKQTLLHKIRSYTRAHAGTEEAERLAKALYWVCRAEQKEKLKHETD